MLAGEEFQHILRVLNTNVDGKQKVQYAITAIRGIGRRFSNIVCKKAEVDLRKRCARPPLLLTLPFSVLVTPTPSPPHLGSALSSHLRDLHSVRREEKLYRLNQSGPPSGPASEQQQRHWVPSNTSKSGSCGQIEADRWECGASMDDVWCTSNSPAISYDQGPAYNPKPCQDVQRHLILNRCIAKLHDDE